VAGNVLQLPVPSRKVLRHISDRRDSKYDGKPFLAIYKAKFATGTSDQAWTNQYCTYRFANRPRVHSM